MAFINCPECNATISSKATTCPHCGAPIAPEIDNEQIQNQSQPTTIKEMPPKTWLLESILATLFCCLPFGIVGIVYASRVESNWYAGNRELAMSSSRTAKTWTLVSFACGILSIIITIIAWAFGLMAGILGGMNA